jgi:adenosine deaminase
MRFIVFCFSLLHALASVAQPSSPAERLLNDYLDSIRHSRAMLRAFFQAMPKGGDLHHHFSGSVYAETYLETFEKNDYWLHLPSLSVAPQAPTKKKRQWRRASQLRQSSQYVALRERLLEKWSVYQYEHHRRLAPPTQFFETFSGFLPLIRPSMRQGLREIKQRAIDERVLYIETMLSSVFCERPPQAQPLDDKLWAAQADRDEQSLWRAFDEAYAALATPGFEACVRQFVDFAEALHHEEAMETEDFVMRYQTYALRTKTPSAVFADLKLAFAAAAASPLIVGVNFVAPEHDPIALRDYWLHMRMFRYLGRKYSGVNIALHAGELALGLTTPENLRWHIGEALRVAGAQRIGHGVSISHEADWMNLLDTLKAAGIPIEINLSSNAFILGIDGDQHPVLLYRRAGAPFVICTDDAGVLRDNLSEQYVLLAWHYPAFSYRDMKNLARAALRHSFIEREDIKERLARKLEQQFLEFEHAMTRWLLGN